MTIRVLNPTSEAVVETMQPAPRLTSLAGKTVGLISNGKEGTAGFFAHVDRLLRERYQVAQVVLRTKSNYSAPAEDEIIDEAGNWDLAITGLGDWGSCSSCSLHDAISSERVGTPAVGVMTSNFVSAAELMANVLGMPGYAFAVIDHPVSSASDAELEAKALQTMAAIDSQILL